MDKQIVSHGCLFLAVFVITVPPTTPELMFGSLNGTSISSSSIYVIKGDDVTIICVSHGNPEPSYAWSGQSKPGQMLKINNIQTDTKRTCTMTYTVFTSGESEIVSTNETVSIVVMYRPSVPQIVYLADDSLKLPIIKALANSSFVYYCFGSEGNPSNLSYQWSGNVSSPISSPNIHQLRKQHAGTCTCTVQNVMPRSFGSTEVGENNASFFLDVLYAPRIQPLPNLRLENGSVLEVACDVIPGNPNLLTYTWTRTKGDLHTHDRLLTIENVTESDADTYTCHVLNVMNPTVGVVTNGTDANSFTLDVFSMGDGETVTEANVKLFIIIGGAGGGGVIVLVVVISVLCCLHRRRGNKKPHTGQSIGSELIDDCNTITESCTLGKHYEDTTDTGPENSYLACGTSTTKATNDEQSYSTVSSTKAAKRKRPYNNVSDTKAAKSEQSYINVSDTKTAKSEQAYTDVSDTKAAKSERSYTNVSDTKAAKDEQSYGNVLLIGETWNTMKTYKCNTSYPDFT